MKEHRNKNKLAAVLTGIGVTCAGAVALGSASSLEAVFNPNHFARFEDRYQPDAYDYVAGGGEDLDLADRSEKSDSQASQNEQQVLEKKNDQNPGPGNNGAGQDEIRQASGEGAVMRFRILARPQEMWAATALRETEPAEREAAAQTIKITRRIITVPARQTESRTPGRRPS